MSLVLSVDPGIRACGCAIFRDGVLIFAAFVKNRVDAGNGPRESEQMAQAIVIWFVERVGSVNGLDDLVLEYPQTYSGRAKRGDANDLFPLAAVDGALAALFPKAQLTSFLPFAWKQNIDADVMIERIKGRLTPEEKARVALPTAASLHHNVWDGVGVGLAHLGRLERKRAFAAE